MKSDNIQGRVVGPGDVRKLADAGLTVVDTTAYQALRGAAARMDQEIEELKRQLGETQAALSEAEQRLALATNDDTMTDIVQGALVELGVRTRLDTGESMRGFCNSVARQIIDELRSHYRAVLTNDAAGVGDDN